MSHCLSLFWKGHCLNQIRQGKTDEGMTRLTPITMLEWLKILPRLSKEISFSWDRVTRHVQAPSLLHCKVRGASGVEETNPLHFAFATDREYMPVQFCFVSVLRDNNLQPQQHTFHKFLKHDTRHRRNVSWDASEAISIGVPTWLAYYASWLGLRSWHEFTSRLTWSMGPGPAPPAGCGRVTPARAFWELHAVIQSRSLRITMQGTNVLLSLPLVCTFHCFLTSRAVLVFVYRALSFIPRRWTIRLLIAIANNYPLTESG